MNRPPPRTLKNRRRVILFVLVPETLPVMSVPSADVTRQPGVSDRPCEVEVAGQPQPGLVSVLPPLEEGVLRWSQQATAGQHSNVSHIPQSLGENAVVTETWARSISISVSVIFRPWDRGVSVEDVSSGQ